MSERPTKHQQAVIDYLRSGGAIEETVSGAFFKKRRIRPETIAKLVASGQVARTKIQNRIGKYNYYLIYAGGK